MCLSKKKGFSSESNNSDGNKLVGLLQLFADTTITTLTLNAIVAYPVHIVFPNFTKQFRKWSLNHGLALVGLHLVSSLGNAFDQEEVYKFASVGELPSSFMVSIL